MSRSWLAACLLAAGFLLLVQGDGPVRPYAGQQARESSGAPSPLAEGVPAPTLGGLQFWADELFFHRWRIQRNVITGHCRLLDGKNFRRASGTYEHCVAKLEQIKRDRNLPPMQGKAVIVLHGLANTRISNTLLCKRLQRAGGYTVFNVTYPSTRRSVAEHAQTLAKIIENLEGIEEINLVGHSLGNIVIRHYLADQTDEQTGRRPDPRIKRLVMLGPPNHGSIAATGFADSKLFGTVLGKAGHELGREWTWLESDLATPQFEFGIIAGGRGNEQGFNPLLPGDDDGIVTVASTRLAGASDFVVVPVLHPLLPANSQVIEYTLRFLQKGYFIAEDQRRPIEQ